MITRGILLDLDNSVVFGDDGRIAMGDITEQNQRLLLSINKGEIKEAPLKGVGVSNFIEEGNPQRLIAEIRGEFRREGLTIEKLQIKGNNIEISAHY
ncbi:MAG: hypothetical protein Q4A56_01695 [Porphyromonadaceae bacterium]|nr:hypothetical protein [Porphyromonadaceae bacterium]